MGQGYRETSVEQHELADFRIAEKIKGLDISVSPLNDKTVPEYRARVYQNLCNRLQSCLSELGLERSCLVLGRILFAISDVEVKK